MSAKGKSLKSLVEGWRSRNNAAAPEKDNLLRSYYEISKEVEQLRESGHSYADLLGAVASLFVGPKGGPAAGVTRATRLIRMYRMSESLIKLAAKQLRSGKRGASISHVLLLSRLESRRTQMELLRWSIAEGAGYRQFEEKVKSAASPSRHRPTIVIKQLDRAVTELDKLLSEVAKPGFVDSVDKTTDRLRKVTATRLRRTNKTLTRVERKLGKCKLAIEEAANLLR